MPCCYRNSAAAKQLLDPYNFFFFASHAGDLLSSSVEKLEPLPASEGGGVEKDVDDAWVEDTKEKAERGRGRGLAH